MSGWVWSRLFSSGFESRVSFARCKPPAAEEGNLDLSELILMNHPGGLVQLTRDMAWDTIENVDELNMLHLNRVFS